eukprot:TRINITY_DN36007_c0_g1_i1.p1 TRINITY_DN36007_c0_g1~~TRINITY_DN36007_c0_g1_i1.p1  ORF type:complete len:135 (-),score=24.07 TRINITY_DN36007_c0_g1_i1:59-463(-)
MAVLARVIVAGAMMLCITGANARFGDSGDYPQSPEVATTPAPGKCCYSGPTDCDSSRDSCSANEEECTKCDGTFYAADGTEMAASPSMLAASASLPGGAAFPALLAGAALAAAGGVAIAAHRRRAVTMPSEVLG